MLVRIAMQKQNKGRYNKLKKSVHNINIQVYVTDTSALKDPILYNKLLEKMPNYRKEKINNFNFPKDRNLSLAADL